MDHNKSSREEHGEKRTYEGLSMASQATARRVGAVLMSSMAGKLCSGCAPPGTMR
jgi:hypothetical protein